jgi:uncharacterized protein (TIGR00251 family)
MARRISVTVKPNARSAALAKLTETEYRAAVREPARNGKANAAVIDLVARYFGLPKSQILIVRGHSSRRKVVELSG